MIANNSILLTIAICIGGIPGSIIGLCSAYDVLDHFSKKFKKYK